MNDPNQQSGNPPWELPQENAPKDCQPDAPVPSDEEIEEAAGEVIDDVPSGSVPASLIAGVAKQRDEYLALAQRIQADFENFRRRNASAKQDARQDAISDTIKSLLPVLDNLDLAVYHAQANGASGPLLEGVDKVRRQFVDTLASMGLSEIKAQGEPFDPQQHNAVAQTPAAKGEKPGSVVEVFQKGYRVGEKIIRYSMVRVAMEE